jgi:hypothetical protein
LSQFGLIREDSAGNRLVEPIGPQLLERPDFTGPAVADLPDFGKVPASDDRQKLELGQLGRQRPRCRA